MAMTPLSPEEVNELVAAKLGWTINKVSDYHLWYWPPNSAPQSNGLRELPDYSRSIGAAFEIIGKLQKDGYTLSLSWCTVGSHFEWILKIMGREFTSEWADTAPMAICLSFLKLP